MMDGTVYYFSIVATKKYDKLGNIKQQIYSLALLEARS